MHRFHPSLIPLFRRYRLPFFTFAKERRKPDGRLAGFKLYLERSQHRMSEHKAFKRVVQSIWSGVQVFRCRLTLGAMASALPQRFDPVGGELHLALTSGYF